MSMLADVQIYESQLVLLSRTRCRVSKMAARSSVVDVASHCIPKTGLECALESTGRAYEIGTIKITTTIFYSFFSSMWAAKVLRRVEGERKNKCSASKTHVRRRGNGRSLFFLVLKICPKQNRFGENDIRRETVRVSVFFFVICILILFQG